MKRFLHWAVNTVVLGLFSYSIASRLHVVFVHLGLVLVLGLTAHFV